MKQQQHSLKLQWACQSYHIRNTALANEVIKTELGTYAIRFTHTTGYDAHSLF